MSPVNLFINTEFIISLFIDTGIVLVLVRLGNLSICFAIKKYNYATNRKRNIVTISQIEVWPL
jgi:hypothetical protein